MKEFNTEKWLHEYIIKNDTGYPTYCDWEDVKEILKAFKDEFISPSSKVEEQKQISEHEEYHTYTHEEVEALLNKFCNEVMVGQSLGAIERSSNGIAKYIIDKFNK